MTGGNAAGESGREGVRRGVADWACRGAAVVAVVAMVVAGRVMWATVSGVGPQEYREAAMVLSTRLLGAGENPYGFEGRPGFTNVYGILYPVVAWPVDRVVGESGFAGHRVTAAGFVVVAVGVVVWALRKARVRWSLAVVGGAYLMVDSCVRPPVLSTMARPDSMGLTLFLAAVLVPWGRGFDRVGLGACTVLSVLGWLTKPYFVLGLPIVATYLVLFHDMRRGAVLGLAGVAIWALAALGVNAVLPAYLHDTLFAHVATAGRDYRHMAGQWGTLAGDVPGLVILIVVAVVAWWRSRAAGPGMAGATAWYRRAALPVSGVDLPAYALVAGAAVFSLSLGGNTGNRMIYLYQVLSPFLVLVGIRFVEGAVRRGYGVAAVALAVDMGLAVWTAPRPPRSHADAWAGWERFLAGHREACVVAPPLAEMAWRQGKTVYDGGFAEYFAEGTGIEPAGLARRVRERVEESREALRRDIVGRRFEVVITPASSGRPWLSVVDYELLRRHYVIVQSAALPMDLERSFVWGVDVWVPRRDERDGADEGGKNSGR